jgi:hypothetical protein
LDPKHEDEETKAPAKLDDIESSREDPPPLDPIDPPGRLDSTLVKQYLEAAILLLDNNYPKASKLLLESATSQLP